jgi:DNA replication protein DnaC
MEDLTPLFYYFTTMEDLIVKLRKDHEAGNHGKRRSYYKCSLVIVDEVVTRQLTATSATCSSDL